MKLKKRWSMGRFLAQAKGILSSQRGISVIFIALLFFMVMMILGFYGVESKYLQVGRAVVDDAVVSAGLAALATAIDDEVAYGDYALDKAEAERVFMFHLKKSLGLDDGFNPGPNSMITGPVNIESFVIYNPEEINPGLQCPVGTAVQSTTIHVVLNFHLKRHVLTELLGELMEVRIHRDVDNYYTLN